MPAIIYNSLPGKTVKQWFVSIYFRHTQLYALDKMVVKAEQLQDGTTFIELENGTKFYGPQDSITSQREVAYDVILKLDKLQKLENSRTVLGVLCSQYVKAEYEKYYKLRKGDIVVDAGAHIGTFTVKAAKAVGDEGRVIAIEPSASNLEFLSRNIEANGLKNVSIVSKGVWGAKDTLKLNISDKRTTGHSFYTSTRYGTEDTEEFQEVEVDTIDNIVKQSGVGPVNFVKMDVEGAEIEAIKGMDETISGDVKLAMEVSHIVAGKGTYQTVIPWLKKKGFQVHRDGGIIWASRKM